MKRSFWVSIVACVFFAANSPAQLGVTKPAESFPGTPLPAGASATITNIGGRTVLTTNQFSTNTLALDPAIQQMLINLQANVEQLLPALATFNNSAQLQAISGVTPPAQTTASTATDAGGAATPTANASGANLSTRAGVNFSTRAGVNSGVNLSQPVAGTAPTTPAPAFPLSAGTVSSSASGTLVPPAVGAPPTPTGVQNPFAGHTGSGSLQRDLIILQSDLERLLPTLAVINNQTRLGGGATNQTGTFGEPNPLAGRFGLPLTNQAAASLTNRGITPLTNTFVAPVTNNSLQGQPLRSSSPF